MVSARNITSKTVVTDFISYTMTLGFKSVKFIKVQNIMLWLKRKQVYRKKCFFTARPIQQEPASEQFLVSPITGEKIPVDKVQQHMKIGKYYNYLMFGYPAVVTTVYWNATKSRWLILQMCKYS